MATERDFDLLDDYVANRLRANERSDFERKLQSDPDLQSEFQVQQRLVKAIKNARMADLKAMLNNTPVPPVKFGTSVGTKLVIGTFVAGLIATGIYFYVDRQDNVLPSKQAEPKTSTADTTNEPVDAETATQSEQADPSAESAVNEQATSQQPEQEPLEETPTERAAVEQPKLDVYDPSEELAENETEIEEAAGERRNSVRAGAPSILTEIDNQNKKYDFNYQFKSGKLILYGPFEKNLYEILEFFTDEKRTAFLYYKDKFYLLNDNTDQVQELSPVTDTALLRKLKEYRGK